MSELDVVDMIDLDQKVEFVRSCFKRNGRPLSKQDVERLSEKTINSLIQSVPMEFNTWITQRDFAVNTMDSSGRNDVWLGRATSKEEAIRQVLDVNPDLKVISAQPTNGLPVIRYYVECKYKDRIEVKIFYGLSADEVKREYAAILHDEDVKLRVVKADGKHLCPHCGGIAAGPTESLLCYKCQKVLKTLYYTSG